MNLLLLPVSVSISNSFIVKCDTFKPLHVNIGTNMAGSGKTESTKDLAKALRILCIVFNCSNQVDFLVDWIKKTTDLS